MEAPSSEEVEPGLGLEAAVDEVDIDLTAPEEVSGEESAIQPGIDTAEQLGFDEDRPALPLDRVALPTRPSLRRDHSVPAPQQPPPPAPPVQDETGNPTDSLSLLQLRRLVTELPKVEPTPYAFVYDDASTFPDEIEEWFSYDPDELEALSRIQSTFGQEWEKFRNEDKDFTSASEEQKNAFIDRQIDILLDDEISARARCLDVLTYYILGLWGETAGYPLPRNELQQDTHEDGKDNSETEPNRFTRSVYQMEWINRNVSSFQRHKGSEALYVVLRTLCLQVYAYDDAIQQNGNARALEYGELWCALTIFYTILEVARGELKEEKNYPTRVELISLAPRLLNFLTEFLARLRWDEPAAMPLSKGTKILLLTWKALLVTFGGISDVEAVKNRLRSADESTTDTQGQPLITASPLDYHLFRREISSKYPAYNPPPPLFPLEPDSNSILPPVKDEQGSIVSNGILGTGAPNNHGASILHQPVHIATPAPSPPPSPAGPGGKGGKKHNYQTNQMFPFLYPPLDESANQLGGKGTTLLQDSLTGKKWTGNEIPASILEAAELFAKRMRATRAMKQLWQERVNFMKYERGWTNPDGEKSVDPLELSPEQSEGAKDFEKEKPATSHDSPKGQDSYDVDVESRLDAVEDYYKNALPHLQSVVIVLLKVILHNVTSLLNAANTQNGGQNVVQDGQNANGVCENELNGAGHGAYPDITKSPISEVDDIRTREIQGKAVSGILILLLKWFKVSHILKFEYLSQLLLDSNYIPLILKLLQSQELERVVNYRCDRDDLSFFHICRAHSRLGLDSSRPASQPASPSPSESAVPPPIPRHRTSDLSSSILPPPAPPEVDELGYPTSDLPSQPITSFSWRAFFSTISYLRALQKICKGKTHRNLLLVQYKASAYLRKALKVPQPQLRLYALKLFKNQVPYCGRKWRQSNMRVITAVYLHCRPELRDEWLAGGDVDAEVEESVPTEQALRALTHWWNVREYGERMGVTPGVLEREQDFFARELGRMGAGRGQVGEEAEGAVVEEAQGEQGWEGQFQVEGW
ncbi:MAG: Factor arrest protein 11 [Bathelium mastoideum]|nr:MAG: Factor arrest protein 11 [Bathelium mastoideum]